MYVYIKSEPGLWTVGFYSPDGQWHSDSDHGDREEAARRVHYLNGGQEKEKEEINPYLLSGDELVKAAAARS